MRTADYEVSLRVQKHSGNFPKPDIRQETVQTNQRMTAQRDIADLRVRLRIWCSRPISDLQHGSIVL